ncbi:tRNA 4-thiouridine(8) synthase ThiI, partial [Candidatus Woesearchaeota archaeon]|nr:tRNA 4-thiouridine(8) synthase ThiI [Candidatus Woesearchaeota archaeon]
MNNCILLRYGEIGLKSKKVRLKFEQQYVHAITEALKRHGIIKFDLKNFGGR